MDARRVARLVAEELGISRLAPRRCGGRPTGFMVAVEGIDGAGLTTTSKGLVETMGYLVEAKIVYAKEPTGSPIGRLIREILSGRLGSTARPEILAHLFAADRLHHLYEEPVDGARGVLGAVASGAVIVLDRYKYSSIAYQSNLGDPGSLYTPEYVAILNALAPPPHILVYLDVDPRTALARISSSRRRLEVFESLERLEKIRAAYLKIVDTLSSAPEWPSSEKRLWVEALEKNGVSVECFYPDSAPLVLKIDARMSPTEVLYKATRGVIETALNTGLLET